MPLTSAPKFVNNHSLSSTPSSNNNNGGKLLICLRDLSKFRDQTLKSPCGHAGNVAQSDVGGNKSSPSFRNPATDTLGNQKVSPDFKSISTVIKTESTESSSQNGCKIKHSSPQRFDYQPAPESDEGGAGSVSPKSEPPDESKKGEEVGVGVSPGGDDAIGDADPSKQLNKLKRFLSTLQQFANDISKDIGDCVQTLIYWLVHAKISVEDFHRRLQQATNFPLRPFVVPFLKASLPLLQMELAQHNGHSPSSFIHPSGTPKNGGSISSFGIPLPSRYHFFPPTLADLPPLLIPFSGALNLSNGFPGDLPRIEEGRNQHFQRGELNGNGKRTSPDTSPRSSASTVSVSSSSSSLMSSFSRPPFKKRRSMSPHPSLTMTSSSDSGLTSLRSDLLKSQQPRESSSGEHKESEKRSLENSSSLNVMLSSAWERFEERSSQIENLLLTLLNVADKCSQKMATLKAQTRQDFERITAHVLRDLTDQRVNSDDYLQKMDAKIKTEKVVNEVKQQAMIEMQRAVAAAEAKASLTVANERMRLERVLDDARKQAKQEILDILNRQEESNENCWNCGRFASETCSGCNEARYCGLFCQHKDWESHHKVCRQVLESSGDLAKTHSHGSRNLLVPMDGLSPWSMVPNFLIGRSPFLMPNRVSKFEKEGPNDMTKSSAVAAIKTERRDTPPPIDLNSNVINSSVLRENNPSSEMVKCSIRASPNKEDKKEEDKDDQEDGKWTTDSP